MKILLVLCLLIASTNAWRYETETEWIAFDIPSNVVENMTDAQHNLHNTLIHYKHHQCDGIEDSARITCTAYEYACFAGGFSAPVLEFKVNLKENDIIRDEITIIIDEHLQVKLLSSLPFTQFQKAVFEKKIASLSEFRTQCTAVQWKCEVSGSSGLYEGFEVGYAHAYTRRPDIMLVRALKYDQASVFNIKREEFRAATHASFLDVIPDKHRETLKVLHSCDTFTPAEILNHVVINDIHESDQYSLEVCRKVGVTYRPSVGPCDEGEKCHLDDKKQNAEMDLGHMIYFMFLMMFMVVHMMATYDRGERLQQFKTSVRNRFFSFMRTIHAKLAVYIAEEQDTSIPQEETKEE